MTKLIPISQIKFNEDWQIRVALCEATIKAYSEAYSEGAKFPPIDVLADGEKFCLLDGFHRVHAARRAGVEEIEANLHELDSEAAFRFALGANSKHGLPRSNVDKRHAVELALKRWPTTSDSQIASICGVSHPFVGSVRQQVQPAHLISAPRRGKDGKNRHHPSPSLSLAKPSNAKVTQPATPHLDKTGFEIPPPLFVLWTGAKATSQIGDSLARINALIKRAIEQNDPIYAEVNAQALIADLTNAHTNLIRTKPYAVCTTCGGQPNRDRCLMCKGRGFVSKFFWDQCVPEEIKRIRSAKSSE